MAWNIANLIQTLLGTFLEFPRILLSQTFSLAITSRSSNSVNQTKNKPSPLYKLFQESFRLWMEPSISWSFIFSWVTPPTIKTEQQLKEQRSVLHLRNPKSVQTKNILRFRRFGAIFVLIDRIIYIINKTVVLKSRSKETQAKKGSY